MSSRPRATEAPSSHEGYDADPQLSKIHASNNQEVELDPHFANNLISREVVVSITGSLNDFARNPELATCTVPVEHAAIWQTRSRFKPNCRKAATRQGDLENVVLVGMKLKKISSTFPCHLAMTFDGAKGNCYSTAGEQFSYLCGANENTPHMDKTLVTANPYLNSEYLKLYPGMTADKLRSELIMRPPGENYWYIDRSHPIVEMMNENAETLQINLAEQPLMDDRYYKIDSSVAERCLSELETELLDNLPVMNLTNWGASIHRVGGLDWGSTEEVCDNIDQRDLQHRLMNTKRRVTAVVQMDYAFT